MAKSKRGPERRTHADPAFGGAGTGDTRDRRQQSERRRNGYISALKLFRGVDYAQIEQILERCPVQRLKAGEILLAPEQPNHFLYLLIGGRLEVHLDSADSPPAYDIGPGECVGEISVIDGEPTSACVRATEPSQVIALHESIFWSELAPLPHTMRNLLGTLSARMRMRNDVTLRALEQELRYQQLQQELAAACEIQVAMLPALQPLADALPGIDLAARMVVVKSVGGDLYDAFPLDEHRLCLAIGDVSGKGMPAALFMVRTVTLLRGAMVRTGELLTSMGELNRGLCESGMSHMFVSLFLMVLDTRNGAAEFVNAGHNPPIVCGSNGALRIIEKPKGLIAGVLEQAGYEIGRCILAPGDTLLLYTDGVTETRNRDGGFYSSERLRRLLQSTLATSAEAVIEATFADLERFADGSMQRDDITLLALRFLHGV